MLKQKNEAERLEFPWGQIEWLASGQQGNSESMTFGRVTIRSGQSNAEHRHPNCDEILHLLQGRLIHTVNDSEFALEPGDTISIPAGSWHNARSVAPQDAVMVVCYSSADRRTEERQPISVALHPDS